MPTQKELKTLFNPKSVAVVGASQEPQKLGAIVTDEVAIFTYGLPEAQANFNSVNVTVHPLTDLKHTAEVARAKKFLKPEQVEAVLDWSHDPHNWAKRQGFK